MPRKTFIFALILVMFVVGLGTGLLIGKTRGVQGDTADLARLFDIEKIFTKKPTFDLLNEGVEVIHARYADAEQISTEDLIYGAMEGMLKALNDPYSVFLAPEDTQIFQDDVGGTFEGIGTEIGMRDEILTVISPLKGNPAERAGVKAGDKILYVDDTKMRGLSLEAAVRLIRGPKGSIVTLTVSREGTERDIKISIRRDTIKIPILEWEKKEGGVAYIAFSHFTETATGDFENIAHEILQSDVSRIVLDLRNNPGGFLEVSVDIAGWFLERGEVVVVEDWGERRERKSHTAQGSAALREYPLVVLINKGSASASEILAGALRDNRGIQLIGETTFGKGSVQELVDLSDGSSIKITVAKWLTPQGTSIQDNGLAADVTVEMTQEIFDREGDVQLERAIEVVGLL